MAQPGSDGKQALTLANVRFTIADKTWPGSLIREVPIATDAPQQLFIR